MNALHWFRRLPFLAIALAILVPSFVRAEAPIKLLFLGDQGHHRPADLAGRLIPALKKFQIEIEYTEDQSILHRDRLSEFDGLLIYANIDEITKDQEAALIEYVESGKGFIPLHCATYCFAIRTRISRCAGLSSRAMVGRSSRQPFVAPEHPIMRGFGGFRSWDETYIHHRHNPQQRTVLEMRRQGEQAEGLKEEPWTWVRTQGKGRVFYTAWGHDARTWKQEGFHNLLARGIHWACGRDPGTIEPYQEPDRFQVPSMTPFRKDVAEFTYTDVGNKIPNYTPSKRWGVQGEPMSKMQNPLSPEESQKHYIVPEGFAAKLWAHEPQLAGKPIAMNWDDRGRLWICETVDYPNELQPVGKGRDRIRICEDSDGDGVADRFTVFAEQLSIPTAIVCYRGGAIVQDGNKTVYLKDVDGDDRADFRQELITGWGIGDTHGGVSNFQYGLDNWIWAMQGYNDSEPVINGVKKDSFRQGFWRFQVATGAADATAPVSMIGDKKFTTSQLEAHTLRVKDVEYVRATNNNTWGLGISEEGLIFGSTANGNPSNFMPIPNRYYEAVKGWAPSTLEMISDSAKFAPATDKVRQVDWHGGYTAAAGHALYTARQFPKAWWNRIAFVCEPTGHIVGSFVLTANGAGYRSTNSFNLMASDDEWAAPIMAEVGPDGAVWVSDWYNFIVQHNPTPHGFETGRGNAYETDLRDKKYGRIYRVVYEGKAEPLSAAAQSAQEVVKKGLGKASQRDLVKVLSHSTMRWRLMAQQLLLQQPLLERESLNDLLANVSNPAVDEVGLNVAAIHSLWVLHAHKQIEPAKTDVWVTVLKALRHSSRGVRRAAVQVLPASEASVTACVANQVLEDSDPQVLLAALLKVADCKITNSAIQQSIATALAKPSMLSMQDRWLWDAWACAVSENASPVMARIAESNTATSPMLSRYLAIVAEHWARSRPDASSVNQWLKGMSQSRPEQIEACMVGITRGWPNDHQVGIDKASDAAMLKILEKLPVSSRSQLAQWGGAIGANSMKEEIGKIAKQLEELVAKESASVKERLDAAQQWIAVEPKNDEVVDRLLELITPQTPAEVSIGWIGRLVQSKANRVGPALISSMVRFTPDLREAAVRVLLARGETTQALLDAMKKGEMSLTDLSLDQRQALRDHPDRRFGSWRSSL